MQIRTRMCTSLDGYISNTDGLMPALEVADQWPWSDVEVFVLSAERPGGTPDDVVIESDPGRLLERIREAGHDNVHLIGGPTTIETYRELSAIDEFGLVVLPIFAGEGMQLTPAIQTDERLALQSARELPRGAVEIVYGRL